MTLLIMNNNNSSNSEAPMGLISCQTHSSKALVQIPSVITLNFPRSKHCRDMYKVGLLQ